MTENGKVLSDMALILPCVLEKFGCKTTSLDPYACIWDFPDNCGLSILRTEEVSMVEQDTKYYVISGRDSTSKLVFEVKKIPQKHCGKPTPFTQKTRTHFIRPESVKVSILKLGEILASRRMVQLKSFCIWDTGRN